MAEKLGEARRVSLRSTWTFGLKLARQDVQIVLAWSGLMRACGLKFSHNTSYGKIVALQGRAWIEIPLWII